MSVEQIFLGYDIGGTKIAVCLGTSAGKLIETQRIDNFNRDSNDVLREMIEMGQEMIKKHKLTVTAIGIGAPGPMDVKTGMITTPVNMPGWRHVRVRDRIAEAFGIPTFFDNDANAGALAEWIFGSGKGYNNLVYATLSTGVGGGIIANGDVVRGGTRNGGEIGHMVLDINGPLCACGQRGCYEAFCGGKAIAMRIQNELRYVQHHRLIDLAGGNLEAIDMRIVEQAVREGDAYACEIWDHMCLRNAQALGGLINVFSPEVIVLGTLAYAAGDLFMEPVRHYLPRFAWRSFSGSCELRVSSLGRSIGEYAGLAVAYHALRIGGK